MLKQSPQLVAMLAIIALPSFLMAQKETSKPLDYSTLQGLEEAPDDPYIFVPKNSQPTSKAYEVVTPTFFTTQVNINDAGENILGDAANEPSIAINPNNPDQMVIGWRQFDTIESNFRQAGFAYTTDGGQTWTFPGVIEPGVFRSDPVLDINSAGDFYYNSLTIDGGSFLCDVFQSEGIGVWDEGTFAHGGDKQWMTIDKTDNASNGNIYAFWNPDFSVCPPGMFTRSIDDGDSYENCTDVTSNPIWGTMDVDSDGTLYAGGISGGFQMVRSANAGNSSEAVIWDFASTVNLGGNVVLGNGPNPAGLLGQTWIAVDKTDGPTQDHVYLLCSVQPNNSLDPLDVMLARSTDGGTTWEDPIRINDDMEENAWQWLSTMAVAPNGRIDVVWLDTRDNPGTFLSSLYHSYSIDGGATFSPNERLSEAFDPHIGWPNQNKMGDYFDMVSTEEGAHLAWAGTFTGGQDVYYSFIPFEDVVDIDERDLRSDNFASLQNYPNPFIHSTIISFELQKREKIRLCIYDQQGRLVKVLIDGETPTGQHQIRWEDIDNSDNRLAPGLYFCELKIEGKGSVHKKILVGG